jgi:hypothetical protein
MARKTKGSPTAQQYQCSTGRPWLNITLAYPDPIDQLPDQETTLPQIVGEESLAILCTDESGDSLTRVQNACESHHVSPAVLIELFVIPGTSLVRSGMFNDAQSRGIKRIRDLRVHERRRVNSERLNDPTFFSGFQPVGLQRAIVHHPSVGAKYPRTLGECTDHVRRVVESVAAPDEID